jgi:hypothetical protein
MGDIAMHTTHMLLGICSNKDVLHEPTNVALDIPSVRPGDLVLTLHEHKTLQACAINFSMVSTPEGAANPTQQRKNHIKKHTVRELEKWKGMSSPTVKPKKSKQNENPTKTPVEPDELGFASRNGIWIQIIRFRNNRCCLPFLCLCMLIRRCHGVGCRI